MTLNLFQGFCRSFILNIVILMYLNVIAVVNNISEKLGWGGRGRK